MENQNEITPSELSEKININEKDIENVFKTLISDGNVIDLSDRNGIKIARDKKVNYSELIKKKNFFNSSEAWFGYILLTIALLEKLFGVISLLIDTIRK